MAAWRPHRDKSQRNSQSLKGENDAGLDSNSCHSPRREFIPNGSVGLGGSLRFTGMKQQTREATSPCPCFFIGKMAQLLSTKCPSGLDTVPGPGVTEMIMSPCLSSRIARSCTVPLKVLGCRRARSLCPNGNQFSSLGTLSRSPDFLIFFSKIFFIYLREKE